MDIERITATLVLLYCGFILGGCVKPEHKFKALAAFIGALAMAAFLHKEIL